MQDLGDFFRLQNIDYDNISLQLKPNTSNAVVHLKCVEDAVKSIQILRGCKYKDNSLRAMRYVPPPKHLRRTASKGPYKRPHAPAFQSHANTSGRPDSSGNSEPFVKANQFDGAKKRKKNPKKIAKVTST